MRLRWRLAASPRVEQPFFAIRRRQHIWRLTPTADGRTPVDRLGAAADRVQSSLAGQCMDCALIAASSSARRVLVPRRRWPALGVDATTTTVPIQLVALCVPLSIVLTSTHSLLLASTVAAALLLLPTRGRLGLPGRRSPGSTYN